MPEPKARRVGDGAMSDLEGVAHAEVCTSETREIGVPLVARQGLSPFPQA
jgi:hypothetical protein